MNQKQKILSFYSLRRDLTPGEIRSAVSCFCADNPVDSLDTLEPVTVYDAKGNELKGYRHHRKPIHEAEQWIPDWRERARRYVLKIDPALHAHLTAIKARDSISIGSLVRLAINCYGAENRKQTASSGKQFVQLNLFE